MATVQLVPKHTTEQRIVLHNVSWQGYEAFLKEFDERPIRLTYDRGVLEIMTLSHSHEYRAEMIGRLIVLMTFQLDIEIHSGGATTFKKQAKEKGLEADKCYWIQHEPQMRNREEFDIDTDPPPDLAVEVEVSRSALDRMAIYAALGIREVWCFDGERLRVYGLGKGGKYSLRPTSLAFPFLPLDDCVTFLLNPDGMSETKLSRAFVQWVEDTVRPRYEAWKREQEPKRPSPRPRRPR